MADVKEVLNVRVSPASRRNLEDAAKHFKLGISDLVDRVLARPEAIATAVMAAFEAVADPGAWRKGRTRDRMPAPAPAPKGKGGRRGKAK